MDMIRNNYAANSGWSCRALLAGVGSGVHPRLRSPPIDGADRWVMQNPERLGMRLSSVSPLGFKPQKWESPVSRGALSSYWDKWLDLSTHVIDLVVVRWECAFPESGSAVCITFSSTYAG